MAACIVFQMGCGGGEVIGLLIVDEGSATIARGSSHHRVNKGGTEKVMVGDTLTGNLGCKATIKTGLHAYTIDAETELVVDKASFAGASHGASMVTLKKGLAAFALQVQGEKKVHRFQVATVSVVAAVKGTMFDVNVADREVKVTVYEGEVDLFAQGDPAVVVVGKKHAPQTIASLKEGTSAVVVQGRIQGQAPVDAAKLQAQKAEWFARTNKPNISGF
ncbi:MAG: FecR domain-containing protein [Candidatus Riflebacteria bacterium]|nr:FecR domain-containing protein [Candidatus Riflebacteria bacterium]